MAKEASLRICKAEVELLTEREHLDLIEPAVRGGVTSAYEERHNILRSVIPLSEILNTPDYAQVGYFVEVDLSYPTHLHDDHRDFFLAPTKDFVEDAWLSDNQI